MSRPPHPAVRTWDLLYRKGSRPPSYSELPRPIWVKGKAEPVTIYRPTGELARTSQPKAALRAIVDRLAPAEQLALKAASAAEQTFASALVRAIFPDASDAVHLDKHLASLQRLGLIEQVSSPVADASELVFSFCNAAIHGIAYKGMLFAQRSHLHRLAAEWHERTSLEDLERYCSTLAHRWRQAEKPDQAIEYLERAARRAQRAGQYEEAGQYLRQSLELDARSAVLSDAFHEQPSANREAASEYALAHLKKELPPELAYRILWHARDGVLPAVQRLATMIGIGEEQTHLLETAAVDHDIGFTVRSREHERLGAERAAQVLPGFGFSPTRIATVQGMSMAAHLLQSPRMPLEETLAGADLEVLGREDFWARSQALRQELAALGTPFSDEEWRASQRQMLLSHRYWTSAARALPDGGKQSNIQALQSSKSPRRRPRSRRRTPGTER